MKRKFLEDLGLEKEVIDKILDENSTDIGKAKGESSSLEVKISTLEAELSKAKDTIIDRDAQLEDLKKVDAAGLQAEIIRLQGENKTKDENHAKELKTLKIDNAISAALTASKAKNSKAVKALLDIDYDKVELDDLGIIKGLEDQIKGLQEAEDSKFLFDTSKASFKGAQPGEAGKEDPDTKVDFSKMTYTELASYMEANPDVKID